MSTPLPSLVTYEDEDVPASSLSTIPPPPTMTTTNIASQIKTIKPIINLAPSIAQQIGDSSNLINPNTRSLTYNPTVEELYAPIVGPSAQHTKNNQPIGFARNHHVGIVEDQALNAFAFDEQYNTFHSYGYAADPSLPGKYVGETPVPGLSVYNITSKNENNNNNNITNPNINTEKKKRKNFGVAGTDSFLGPWRAFDDVEKRDEEIEKLQQVNKLKEGENASEKDKEKDKGKGKRQRGEEEEEEEETEEEKKKKESGTTIFHGGKEQLKDYLGRSWMEPPSHLKVGPHDIFLPKKWIHTWSGHTQGVNITRFFPEYGHLILSAGLDGRVKIWDVYNKRKVIRTYLGHSKGVRDVCFSTDGKQFLSASFDRIIKLWDTETGQVLHSFTNNKSLPYVVKFHPTQDCHEFLSGWTDNKILQFDTRAPDKFTQEYTEHLGTVNTITFTDNNRRFVSSSDDKSLRLWDYGTPVTIKYVSEPHMHSMPAIEMHPNGKYILAQSLDNQILVYSTGEKFTLNKKKRFTGHLVSGYACQVGCSPDGRYVLSGDGDGKLWIWDWKSAKVFKTLKAHDGVCIGAVWHPLESSKVVTCGWDSTIKYWD